MPAELREAEIEPSRGKSTGAVCRLLGVSVQTCDRWRTEYCGLRVDQAKRFEQLEQQDGRRRKLVTERTLDGLAGGEGTSRLRGVWLVGNLAPQGRRDEAVARSLARRDRRRCDEPRS